MLKFSPEIEFRKDRCTGCGTCTEVCPERAIITDEQGIPSEFTGKCIGCGHCGAYCPENAFDLEPIRDHSCDSALFMELCSGRRSGRFFRPDSLSDRDLENLLSVTGYSPTGCNACGIHITVVNGRKAVNDLLAPVRKLFSAASILGIPQLAGKLTGQSPFIERFRAGEDILFREAPAVLFFHVPKKNATCGTDGIIAASMVMMHAETMGIATLWNGFAEALYPLIPGWHDQKTRGKRLTAVLCAGYPSRRPLWKPPPRDYVVIQ